MTTCGHCGEPHDEQLDTCPRTGWRRSAQGPCGTAIDRYFVDSLIGTGGFGSVYRAHHVHTDQLVALKILRRDLTNDPQMLERLFLEARAAARIDDPRIVKVSDCGLATTGEAFIAMELLDGRDLRHVLDHGPQPTQRKAVEILLEVLAGLQAAHSNGVVHRDLKPANIFLARQRGREQVKLLDFGISKMRAADSKAALTRANTAMGTPAYMAPEQMQDARSVDGRADLYSVAAMAYELLCGERPFEGVSYEDVMLKVFTQTAIPLAERVRLPAALCHAIDRGLLKDPAARWQSARDFANALRPTLSEVPAREAPPREEPHRPTVSPLPATVPLVATPVVAPARAAPLVPAAAPSRLMLGVTLGGLIALAGAAVGIWATQHFATSVAAPRAVVVPARTVAPPRAVVPPPQPEPEPAPAPASDLEPEPPPKIAKPAPRPRLGSAAVQVHEPNIVGELDYEAVHSLLSTSSSSLDGCRTSRTVTVHVHLHTHGEGVGLARDDPNKQNEDLEAARCVANRLKAAASHGWKSGGSGIIAVSVTLAQR